MGDEGSEVGSDVLLDRNWVCERMMRGRVRLFSSVMEAGDAERGVSI